WRFAIFSPLPPPPRSSLFPYTTLFRSLPPDAVASFVDEVTNGGLRFVGDGFSKGRIIVRSPEECPLASEEGGDGLVRGELLADPDRKSTRLNSSHVKISYADFCLKKKH